MLRAIVESIIDAVCYCCGITRRKNAKQLKDASEFYEFMKQQKELAARAKYSACC